MRRSSRSLPAAQVVVGRRPRARAGRRGRPARRGRPGRSRRRRVRERLAAVTATTARGRRRVGVEAVGACSGWSRASRSSATRDAAGAADRSMASSSSGVARRQRGRVSARPWRTVHAGSLAVCPGCASRCARSTPSSATSTATSSASSPRSTQAEAAGCDVAVFPELAITGYPPEDLLLKPGFVADNRAALEKVAARTGRCAAVVGFVDAGPRPATTPPRCAPAARCRASTASACCPTTPCSTSSATSPPGSEPLAAVRDRRRAGRRVDLRGRVEPDGPIAEQAAGGAELIVNLNASPYYAGRLAERERMLATRAADASCALVYVNQVGGQDELVFDGASIVVDADGELVARAPQFVEDGARRRRRRAARLPQAPARPPGPGHAHRRCPTIVVSRGPRRPRRPRRAGASTPALEPVDEVYEALVLGTARLRHARTGSPTSCIGLSGGIDSSLVAAHRRRRPRRRARARRARCRRATRARAPQPTPRRWPTTSASTTAPSPSSRPTPRSSRCWRRRSTGASRGPHRGEPPEPASGA